MKKLLMTFAIVCISVVANAQYSESDSSWDFLTMGIKYAATTENADKGVLGYEIHRFYGEGKPIGMSMSCNNVYSIASKKWFETFSISIGPNINYPVNDNLILFAPLYATISNGEGSDKIHVGASLVPSIGVKVGSLFVSAGWNVSYSFTADHDAFNAKSFSGTISVVTTF